MLGTFSTQMSLCIQRRNPVRVPRRDVLIVASDTPYLALTIYQQDTDTLPVDVTGASFVISVYRERDERRQHWGQWDYGFGHDLRPYILAQFFGTLTDPVNGRVDFALMALPQNYVVGRLWFELTMSYPAAPPLTVVTVGMQAAGGGIGDFAIGDTAIGGNQSTTTTTTTQPNYSQGNYTILSGIIEFPFGAQVPFTPYVAPIGAQPIPSYVIPVNALLGADGAPLLGADGAFLLQTTGIPTDNSLTSADGSVLTGADGDTLTFAS